MVKKVYAITIAVIIIALLIAGIAVYELGINTSSDKGTNTTATPVPALKSNNVTFLSEPVSAFQAIAIADNNATVAGWISGKNAYLTDVMSEICVQGLSKTWMLTYNVGDQQASVLVSNGAVSDISTTNGAVQSPKITTTSLLDSDKAINISQTAIEAADQVTTGPVTMEIMPGAQNTPIWDVTYKVQGGYYLVRLNATDGAITGSTNFTSG
jgi:uncharacterized protein YpmB